MRNTAYFKGARATLRDFPEATAPQILSGHAIGYNGEFGEIPFTYSGTITNEDIHYSENIHAAFVEFENQSEKFYIGLGLRAEFAEIKLDGYETRVITLDRKFNAVSIINLGSLIGWGIDAATGSIMKYDKKGYDIELEKDNRTSFNNPIKIEINTKDRLVDVYVAEKK